MPRTSDITNSTQDQTSKRRRLENAALTDGHDITLERFEMLFARKMGDFEKKLDSAIQKIESVAEKMEERLNNQMEGIIEEIVKPIQKQYAAIKTDLEYIPLAIQDTYEQLQDNITKELQQQQEAACSTQESTVSSTVELTELEDYGALPTKPKKGEHDSFLSVSNSVLATYIDILLNIITCF